MSRRVIAPVGILVLAAGCVPVSAPLSDPEKVEPDKTLVGTWTAEGGDIRIDVTTVKGNPAGLMRFGSSDANDDAIWFVTDRIGGHTYLTALLQPGSDLKPAAFGREGEYAAWKKQADRRYGVARYKVSGDELAIHLSTPDATTRVMEAAKIDRIGKSDVYATPAGWLAGYLEKDGPAKLFPTSKGSPIAFKRVKK